LFWLDISHTRLRARANFDRNSKKIARMKVPSLSIRLSPTKTFLYCWRESVCGDKPIPWGRQTFIRQPSVERVRSFNGFLIQEHTMLTKEAMSSCGRGFGKRENLRSGERERE
jgi:hypothetical protein